MDIVEVGAIVIICLFVGMWLKNWKRLDNNYIPHVLGGIGGTLGIVALYIMPDFPANDIITAFATGILSGLGSVGVHQAFKPMYKSKPKPPDG
jgi:hypothetical protein